MDKIKCTSKWSQFTTTRDHGVLIDQDLEIEMRINKFISL